MSEERFNVVIHHGGTLVTDIPFRYVGGEVTYWSVDPDKWSYFEVVDSIKELGYINVSELFYSIDHILYKLYDDRDVMNMIGIAKHLKEVNLFVVHFVDEELEIIVEDEVAVGMEDEVVVQGEEDVEVAVQVEEEEEVVVQVKDMVEENIVIEEEEVAVQGVEDEEVVIEQHRQVEEEVVIEEFSSSEDDDAWDVHGEVPHGVVDEEEVDEGLVDVGVNIDEGLLHNDVQGSVSVEFSENESNCDSDTDDSGHRQRNPNDRGLSDDEWESEALDSPKESGSEDGVDERQSCGPFGTYVKQKNMSKYKWEVGTKFSDKNEFMDAGRNLKFLKNDNRRVRVRCLGVEKKCPWMTYCGYLEGCRTWQLRKILDTHTCNTTLLENPNLKINEIRSKALRKWNTNVTLSKARRAKLMASCKLEGSSKDQFTRIFDYAHELLRCNPGSTVKVKVDSENGQTTFQRFYVYLKACKNSFVSCRPFIGLDGCFLKRKYKGDLLTTVAKDPNEQMLPLAYAIVEKDLGGTEVCDACTFMSDQQKGLPVLEALLPKAEHRFCMRHLYANFRKKFRGHTLKTLMWKAATSTYPQVWEREMLNMKELPDNFLFFVIGIGLDLDLQVEQRSTYDETYASIIFPVNTHHLWERTSCPDVLPPFKRKLPGRSKKKRRLESWELGRDETQMTIGSHHKKCSICRVVGHNRNQCPLRPQDQPDLPQPSEAPPPQPTQESTEMGLKMKVLDSRQRKKNEEKSLRTAQRQNSPRRHCLTPRRGRQADLRLEANHRRQTGGRHKCDAGRLSAGLGPIFCDTPQL
ncbi:hypothetical protein V8G54_034551 [Vigna mungo]|uniref:PB1-like domain-containing protein n=1 Tax=Vigna mungo TaxID=3915 RepID=A0AAQ3RHE3_VIGMU